MRTPQPVVVVHPATTLLDCGGRGLTAWDLGPLMSALSSKAVEDNRTPRRKRCRTSCSWRCLSASRLRDTRRLGPIHLSSRPIAVALRVAPTPCASRISTGRPILRALRAHQSRQDYYTKVPRVRLEQRASCCEPGLFDRGGLERETP
jgi:hypothetical protein